MITFVITTPEGEAFEKHRNYSVRVAPAAPILTSKERVEPEGLMRSTMTHYRTRFQARTVLMTADGVATRAIAREVNRAIGTAAKGRVRYAQDRAIEADD
jgi:hypothetical protein